MSLRTRSMSDAVYEQIKSDMLVGRYKPGERILENELSEQLEVSRTPIRNALVRLQGDGLVIIHPHRGVFVRELTVKDIEDHYQVRGVLEGLGAKLAAENLTKKNEDELKEMLNQMKKIHENGENEEEIIHMNDAFHDYIFELAGNNVLDNMRQTLATSIALVRATSWKNTSRKFETLKEHETIINEILKRNPIQAQKAAEEHVYNVWQSASKNLD